MSQTIAPDKTAEQIRAELEGTLRFIREKYAARRRAVETIDYLKRHLIELGVPRSLTRPLDDVSMAFAEAERGRLLPLFEPKEVGHKLPTELSRLYVMAKAAVAMDLLMAAKVKKEKAARHIAHALRKHSYPIKGKLGVPDWKTVVGWREKLRKKKGNADAYGKFIYHIESEHYLSLVKTQKLDPKALVTQQIELIGEHLNAALG